MRITIRLFVIVYMVVLADSLAVSANNPSAIAASEPLMVSAPIFERRDAVASHDNTTCNNSIATK